MPIDRDAIIYEALRDVAENIRKQERARIEAAAVQAQQRRQLNNPAIDWDWNVHIANHVFAPPPAPLPPGLQRRDPMPIQQPQPIPNFGDEFLPGDDAEDVIAHQEEEMLVQEKPKFQIFWGGADVDPSMYNRKKSNMCGRTFLERDHKDMEEMQQCIDNGIPIIGICRSSQLLNVLNGGILVQHIEGHGRAAGHNCIIDDGFEPSFVCNVSSTHHQMMVAHKDGQIIGKSTNGTKGVHWDETDEWYDYKYVTEVVYYPKTKSLCIQPHPEWMYQDSDFVNWINRFIKREFNLNPINFKHEEDMFNRNQW